jgi:hypothetical protein
MRRKQKMASGDDPKQHKIDEYIDKNLKTVFSDYENDAMPDEIVDLLTALRAQDAELKAKNEQS